MSHIQGSLSDYTLEDTYYSVVKDQIEFRSALARSKRLESFFGPGY